MQKYTVTVDDIGTQRWYNEKGELHRLNGPAVESVDGKVQIYFINGQEVSKEIALNKSEVEYLKFIDMYNNKKEIFFCAFSGNWFLYEDVAPESVIAEYCEVSEETVQRYRKHLAF